MQLSNNQLNKVIGQRWNELPESKRKFYIDMAEKDKERFQEVISVLDIQFWSTSFEATKNQ